MKRLISEYVDTGRPRRASYLLAILLACAAHALAAGESVSSSAVGSADFPKLAAIVEQAKRGDARAQFKLGDYYYARGEFQAAVSWYERSARQGHAVAQTALANCYAAGRGVKRNPSEAAKWSRMAAHQKALPPEAVRKKPVQASKPQGIQQTAQAGAPLTSTASVTPTDRAETNEPTATITVSAARAEDGPQQSSGAGLVSPAQATRDVPSTLVSRVWKLEAPRPAIQDGDRILRFRD